MKKLLFMIKIAEVKKTCIVAIVLLGVLSSYLEITPTNILGKISDEIIKLANTQVRELDGYVVCLFIIFAGMMIASTIIRNAFCYFTSKYSNAIIYSIRKKAYQKLLNVNYGYINSSEKAQAVNTIYNNTGRLEMVFSTALFTLMSDLFDLIMISMYIVMIDPWILLFLIVPIPVIYMLGIKSGRFQKAIAQSKIGTEEKIISTIHETYSAIDSIRIFRGKRISTEKMDRYNKKYRDECNESDFKLSAFFIFEKTLRTFGKLISLLYIAANIIKGDFAVGNFLVIALYTDKFYAPITNITRYFQMIQNGMASIDNIIEFLNLSEDKTNQNITFSKENVSEIKIADASVSVNGLTLVNNISCRFTGTGLNILLGKSGRGKSSLIKSILGIYPLTGGTITMNSQMESDAPLFAYASQNITLFNKSVIDNCLYPENMETASTSQIDKAKQLLLKLSIPESQFSKLAGEEGVELSGGEGKRIAFIRALMSPAPVLILDEITSNLDQGNKIKMEELIVNESKERCVILISHELGRVVSQYGYNEVRL